MSESNIKPSANKEAMVAALKEELVHVLMQLDEIETVIFEDEDCSGGIYNFGDVVLEGDNTVIKLRMWADNLPNRDGNSVETIRNQENHNKEEKAGWKAC